MPAAAARKSARMIFLVLSCLSLRRLACARLLLASLTLLSSLCCVRFSAILIPYIFFPWLTAGAIERSAA